MSSVGPEPGWYLDPERRDTQRYWNGAAWTEHRKPTHGAMGPAPAFSSGSGGFKSFWLGLSDSGRGWIIIGGIAAVIVAVVVVTVAITQSESRDYKDCVHAGQVAVDGTPGNTQSDLKAYCEEAVGK